MTSSSETSKFSPASSADAPAPTGGRRRLKIAVYGICKNKERHVARFMESVRDTDQVLIADTGSTDATVAALRAAGSVVPAVWVSPWRFDDARNAALWRGGPDAALSVWVVQQQEGTENTLLFIPLVPASPRHPKRCLGHPAKNDQVQPDLPC